METATDDTRAATAVHRPVPARAGRLARIAASPDAERWALSVTSVIGAALAVFAVVWVAQVRAHMTDRPAPRVVIRTTVIPGPTVTHFSTADTRRIVDGAAAAGGTQNDQGKTARNHPGVNFGQWPPGHRRQSSSPAVIPPIRASASPSGTATASPTPSPDTPVPSTAAPTGH